MTSKPDEQALAQGHRRNAHAVPWEHYAVAFGPWHVRNVTYLRDLTLHSDQYAGQG